MAETELFFFSMPTVLHEDSGDFYWKKEVDRMKQEVPRVWNLSLAVLV